MSTRSVAKTAIVLAIASAACQRPAQEAAPQSEEDVVLLRAASEGRVGDVNARGEKD
ncbi:MAG: hypothetical protein JSV41_01325 [Gemmatimonadota bacterium]|nr:MAG: hypothetical protein JSV41_01325 [Gemmatimonadota bacterium]